MRATTAFNRTLDLPGATVTAVRFAQATSALNATGLGSQAGVESFEHTLNFMKTTKTR